MGEQCAEDVRLHEAEQGLAATGGDVEGESASGGNQQNNQVSTAEVKASLAEGARAFLMSVNTFLPDRAAAAEDNGSDDAKHGMPVLQRSTSVIDLSQAISLTLEWRSLTYKIPVGRGKKRSERTILNDLSGVVSPGRLLAIMGPTGCGKTSLLNALAGRLPRSGKLEGQVLVNGLPLGQAFRMLTAYVQQDDVLFHNLTVRETFTFAANMRLGSTVSKAVKEQAVTQIISQLGLIKAQDTFIGNDFVRGVSGGERKRVNIGVEMLSNPSLIFLDEPTSGLDAFQAQSVMEALWTLARNGRTVLACIHQPRSSIYRMFDLLLLLSEGHTVYNGPAKQAAAYFADLGFVCPAMFNPADFFLDLTSPDYRTPEAEQATRTRIEQLVLLYGREARAYNEVPAAVSKESTAGIRTMNELPTFKNNVAVEFGLLLKRSWTQNSRDRLVPVVTLVQTVLIGFVLAALYSNIPVSLTGVQDTIGVLFFVCIFAAMGAIFGSVQTFPTERNVVNRERSSKQYRVLPYYVAKFIADMPLRVGQGLLFGVILYWIAGLNKSAAAFFIFCAILILESLASQGLGVAISAAVKNEKLALAIAPALTVILILFGGFYATTDTIPVWLSWIKYISHLWYAFMALSLNEFRDNPTWSCQDSSTSCAISGEATLERLDFAQYKVWQGILGLIGLACFYNLIGYLFLRFKKPRFLAIVPSHAKTM